MALVERKLTSKQSIFRAMPGYPWLDPCPRCGFRGDSCDCTVLERARIAHPGLIIPATVTEEAKP